jgi:single-strand DNA-binding protein
MNINKIICTGRLTKDPELKALPSGTNVCELRLAVDGMGRAREVGYVNVSVFGNSAEAAAKLPHQGLARRSRRPFGIRRVGQRRNQTPRLHGGGQRRVPDRPTTGGGGGQGNAQAEGARGGLSREVARTPAVGCGTHDARSPRVVSKGRSRSRLVV